MTRFGFALWLLAALAFVVGPAHHAVPTRVRPLRTRQGTEQ